MLPIPVVGVIRPGARAAAELTRSGRIGVLATDGTVASGAYGHAVRDIYAEAVVVERSASWLVPMIEEGRPARTAVAVQLAPTLTELRNEEIDTLILGCTHFPIIRDIFDLEAGPEIAIVDSAVTTAHEVAHLLDALGLQARGTPDHRLLVTGPAEAFERRARAMFRASPRIETVQLAFDLVP
jgi:glutamate racemase